MNGVRAAGDQRVPPFKISSFGDGSVATGFRKPIELKHIFRCDLIAVPFNVKTAIINLALTCLMIQVSARNGGKTNLAGFLISESMQAADAASAA